MNTVTATSNQRTKGLTQVALFAALIFLMAFTPFLGYIPLGFTRATIIHIPVIIGSLVLGPGKGAFLALHFLGESNDRAVGLELGKRRFQNIASTFPAEACQEIHRHVVRRLE